MLLVVTVGLVLVAGIGTAIQKPQDSGGKRETDHHNPDKQQDRYDYLGQRC